MAKKKRSASQAFGINAWIRKQPTELQPELRNARDELKELFRTPEHTDFTWWHRVGSQVMVFFPEEESRYGDSVIELLADYLDPNRVRPEPDTQKGKDSERKGMTVRNRLYEARDFARAYSGREAGRLATVRNKKDKPLSISHVKALLSEQNAGMRQQFLDKCLDESWSVRRLRQAIQNNRGRKLGSGLEPKSPDPQEPGVALRNIFVLSRDWVVNHKVWFDKGKPTFRQVKEKDCTKAILEDAQKTLKKLGELQTAVTNGSRELRSYVQELKKRLPS